MELDNEKAIGIEKEEKNKISKAKTLSEIATDIYLKYGNYVNLVIVVICIYLAFLIKGYKELILSVIIFCIILFYLIKHSTHLMNLGSGETYETGKRNYLITISILCIFLLTLIVKMYLRYQKYGIDSYDLMEIGIFFLIIMIIIKPLYYAYTKKKRRGNRENHKESETEKRARIKEEFSMEMKRRKKIY